ncbi:Ferrichrome-iron receptor precursor [Vibrio aerogenes CECT 7868]|uniref:Ferrichrome-iron receptor n=1 Tax=Vibrio aerogenes CECT 7868 TaxID=1216006 RepID=A0A1M5ZPT2_9VIBR|nr:TonB-dependent siderophore receptor [Vibrio aerogenes]SHI26287.1 Ferrichrome-iron receptor precursor [Vibrio aerogenes CECT 7868]
MTIKQTIKFKPTPVVTAISLSLLTMGATAAENQPSEKSGDQDNVIQVFGQTYRNTATKTSLAPEETPQAISVIDSTTLENQGVKSLNQALRYTPGVVTEVRGGAVTLFDTFNIRGFDAPQSYYDGLMLQLLKGWNLQPQIDPVALQQVEVFKGPTSVLYGTMPPGGMVNMIAKSPRQTPSTEVQVATGSRNLSEVSVDSTGQISDSNVAYRIIALSRKQDSQVDYSEEERQVIAPSLDWQITDNTLLNLNLYYQHDPDMGVNSAIPSSGMFHSNPNGSTSPSTFVGDTHWNHLEREFWLAGYKINHAFNQNWSFLQNVRYMDASLNQRNTYHLASSFDEATGTLGRNIYSTDESSYGLTADNQLSGMITTDNTIHSLLLGIDYQKLDGHSLYQEYASSDSAFYQFNLFHPDNSLLDTSTLSTIYRQSSDISVRQTGVYLQDQLQWDQLVLIAGGRFDYYKSDTKVTISGTDSHSRASHHAFSYRIGALYEFENGIAPYISYATSFEPAAGTDANGHTFDPQTGKQAELGLKYDYGDFTGSAAWFHIVKNDILTTDPDNSAFQVQLGEVTSQGLELQGKWDWSEQWDIEANYTYMDMEVTHDTQHNMEGKTPIWIPRHRANLSANYHVQTGALAGVRLSGGVRYVGEMEIDAANTGKVPDYTLVDLSAGYDLKHLSPSLDGAEVNLIATNLFDKEYYSCYSSANCWYGAERTVEVNVKYQF